MSNPKSPQYGEYLTPEELASIIAPPEERLNEFLVWLAEQGIEQCSAVRTKDAVKCIAHERTLEKALDIQFSAFRCKFTGKVIMRSSSPDWKLPSEWDDLVELVHGITDFPPLCTVSQRFQRCFV